MNIGKIAGYIGAGLLTASCTMKKPAAEKALEHTSKYLKGSELFVAEKKHGICQAQILMTTLMIFFTGIAF